MAECQPCMCPCIGQLIVALLKHEPEKQDEANKIEQKEQQGDSKTEKAESAATTCKPTKEPVMDRGETMAGSH